MGENTSPPISKALLLLTQDSLHNDERDLCLIQSEVLVAHVSGNDGLYIHVCGVNGKESQHNA